MGCVFVSRLTSRKTSRSLERGLVAGDGWSRQRGRPTRMPLAPDEDRHIATEEAAATAAVAVEDDEEDEGIGGGPNARRLRRPIRPSVHLSRSRGC